MFLIIFCKVSTLDNVKQRQERPKKMFSLLATEGLTVAMKQLARLVNTKFCISVKRRGRGYLKLAAKFRYRDEMDFWTAPNVYT